MRSSAQIGHLAGSGLKIPHTFRLLLYLYLFLFPFFIFIFLFIRYTVFIFRFGFFIPMMRPLACGWQFTTMTFWELPADEAALPLLPSHFIQYALVYSSVAMSEAPLSSIEAA
jgi:hypothetical protein